MINKIYNLKRALGAVNAGLYLVKSLFSRSFLPIKLIKYYFVAQKLSSESILPSNRGRNISVKEFSSYTENNPCPRSADVIKQRYDQGAVCFSAFKSDEYCGSLWYIKHQYKEDEVNCLYQLDNADAVWDFDVYVEPKFRLSPVFLKLWDEASRRLVDEGYNWSLSRIDAFNVASMSSHKRMGAETLGSATFICFGPVQLTISNILPFIHFSLGPNKFPVFKLKLPE